jgi:hypothetical protein
MIIQHLGVYQELKRSIRKPLISEIKHGVNRKKYSGK